MKITLIAALTNDGVIGNQGKIPWHISEDLKRFKQTTLGHTVVMGRKTFDSLGKPLPGRANIVITRNPNFKPDGALVFHDVEQALAHCRTHGEQNVFIIGGGEIYRQTIDLADELLLTYVRIAIQGDTHFPEFSPADWEEISREEHETFSFVELRRKKI